MSPAPEMSTTWSDQLGMGFDSALEGDRCSAGLRLGEQFYVMYVVYALKSLSTDQIYIGQTNAIERRLKEHNSGIVKSTKNRMPWELIAIQEVRARSEARWIERSLKNSHEKRNRWVEKNKIL